MNKFSLCALIFLSACVEMPEVQTLQVLPDAVFEETEVTLSYDALLIPETDEPLRFDWFVNDVVVDSVNTNSLTGDSFDKDDTVYGVLTFTAKNGETVVMSSNTITVQNTPPSVGSAGYDVSDLSELSTVTCLGEGWTDPDPSDAESYSYSWQVNGVEVSTASTLNGSDFSKGDTVACVLTPMNGVDAGDSVTGAELVVQNTPPSVGSAGYDVSDLSELSTVTCLGEGWTDPDPSDAESYSYSWQVNGVEVSTASTLNGSDFSKGDTVACVLTPMNGVDAGDSVFGAELVVQNTAPVIGSVDIVPALARTADTLSVVLHGLDDADGDSTSVVYAWYVNDQEVGQDATLSSSLFVRGDVVYLTALVSDGEATAQPVSTEALTIANTAPTLSSVSLSQTDVFEGDTIALNLGPSEDLDGDPVSFSYAWFVNDVEVSAESTINGALFSKGDRVHAVVTPLDGLDAGEAALSPEVTILNTAPSAPVVVLAPELPIEAVDDLLCSVATPSIDVDGDAISYTYSWVLNTVAADAQALISTDSPGDTVSAASLVADDVWRCTVSASDGLASSTASAEVTIYTDAICLIPGDINSCQTQRSNQLYCNGSCSWAGAGFGCDQADADIFCKLTTLDSNAYAVSFDVVIALDEPGFSCPNYGQNLGPQTNVGVTRDVWFQSTSILANHGAGDVVSNVICGVP